MAIREVLSIIDFIDGTEEKYDNYTSNSMNEIEYLDQQTTLVNSAKEKLVSIFKE